MSNWVHVIGAIKVNGVLQEGLKRIYNLKNQKEIDKFYSSTKNWTYVYKEKPFEELYIDMSEDIRKFVETLKTPTGSEGDMEMNYCRYYKQIEAWGDDCSSCETIDYNIETQEVNMRYYLTEEQQKDPNWHSLWLKELGSRFAICISGDLRDRDLDHFKKEFDKLLELLKKCFFIEDIHVKANEDWNNRTGFWSYNIEDEIEYKETKDVEF